MDIKKEVTPSDYDIGVIVGRFQVHELHDAHRQLIQTVVMNHKKVVLFLGVPRVLNSKRNPLDFPSRAAMIQAEFPTITIISLQDKRADEIWSAQLDQRLKECHPVGKPLLYGSRDSFLPFYKGKHDSTELTTDTFLSGTEVRKHVSREIRSSADFRAGVIYATYNRYPISYQTTDIACFNEKGELLLGKKPGEDKWRFIGGFVDPDDESLERAARREFTEEATAETGDYSYITSMRVNDWRYAKEEDKIMTVLYKCKYLHGPLQPADDIEMLKWFDFKSTFQNVKDVNWIKDIMPEHINLMRKLISAEKHTKI